MNGPVDGPGRGVVPARIVLAVSLVAEAVVAFLLLHRRFAHDLLPSLSNPPHWMPVLVVLWVPALLAFRAARLTPRRAAALVLGVGVLLQVVAMSAGPQSSDDALRYVWDGKVQLSGTDPYRYAPDAPELAGLHEPLLDDAYGVNGCTVPTGCPTLNRPDVRTVYPPVAQLAFDAVRVATFGGQGGPRGGVWGFQLAAALGAIAVTVLLLRRRTADPATVARRAAIWAWCPAVAWECGNNAHIDWLAVLLVLLGLDAARRRPGLAGLLVGAAIATKLYPALVMPTIVRRHPVRVVVAAAAVVLLGYVPHVLAVGAQVIGYLPGYLNEEGYSDGGRLLLLRMFLPDPWDTAVGGLILVVGALVAWRRGDPDRPERAAVHLAGLTFLVTTPNYPWYTLILVLLVAMTGRWQWLPLVVAPMLTYHFGPTFPGRDVATPVYEWAALVVAGGFGITGVHRLWIRRRSGHDHARVEDPPRVSS